MDAESVAEYVRCAFAAPVTAFHQNGASKLIGQFFGGVLRVLLGVDCLVGQPGRFIQVWGDQGDQVEWGDQVTGFTWLTGVNRLFLLAPIGTSLKLLPNDPATD